MPKEGKSKEEKPKEEKPKEGKPKEEKPKEEEEEGSPSLLKAACVVLLICAVIHVLLYFIIGVYVMSGVPKASLADEKFWLTPEEFAADQAMGKPPPSPVKYYVMSKYLRPEKFKIEDLREVVPVARKRKVDTSDEFAATSEQTDDLGISTECEKDEYMYDTDEDKDEPVQSVLHEKAHDAGEL